MEYLDFKGEAVSPNFGTGIICVFKNEDCAINKGKIKDDQVNSEIEKFEVAICETVSDIDNLNSQSKQYNNDVTKNIMGVYKFILEDSIFIEDIKDTIKNLKCHAEKAIDLCIDKYIKIFKKSGNKRTSQKVYDINDIRTRLLKNILGYSENLDYITSQNIVVVKELTPSLATVLANKNVKGIVAQEGAGYISHSAIILRSFGIPILNNINYKEVQNYDNYFGVIDAKNSLLKVVLNEKNVQKYIKRFNNKEQKNVKRNSIFTKDGYKVNLLVNINTIEELNRLNRKDIDGVGLVRTETLFLNDKELPNERIQSFVYAEIAKIMKDKPVVIRTADVGSDKMRAQDALDMPNLRGIGGSLIHKESLVIQLRAIIRAARSGNISIMFPMVTNHNEIQSCKEIINDIYKELSEKDGKQIEKVPIGAVIESIESVANMEDIIKEVDFISIGTNDLIQQTIGVNRKNNIKEYQYLCPEFLSNLQYCISVSKKYNKSISVCGEMAADPIGAIILSGMEIENLSMSFNNLERIKNVIVNLNFFKAKSFIKGAINCKDEESVKDLFFSFFNEGGY